MSTIFITKPEVAEMMMMTQYLSSLDTTEKFSISHPYVFRVIFRGCRHRARW